MPQPSNQRPDEVLNAAKVEPPARKDQGEVEPSGYQGKNPATAGPGATGVSSSTPENALGHLNPSAPEDANVTPGSSTVK